MGAQTFAIRLAVEDLEKTKVALRSIGSAGVDGLKTFSTASDQAAARTRAFRTEAASLPPTLRTVDSTARTLASTLGSIGIAISAREVGIYADAWTRAGNLLAAAGVQQERVADTQARLVQLAIRTRTGLEETTNTYAGLTRAAASLGVTQAQMLRGTEIINEAFKSGGAAASEQAAGILQLKQALSSGVLQGDELRSIRENAPLIAKAIADEFGVTIGQLKVLGQEGQLTSDRVFSGILKAGQAIDAQFAATKSTVGDAFTNLRSSVTQYLGTLDKATGVSQGFVGFVNAAADEVHVLGSAALAAGAVLGGRGFVGAIDAARGGVAKFTEGLRENAAAVAERLAVAKAANEAAALEATLARENLALTTHAMNVTRDLASATEGVAAAYRTERSAIAEVEAARKALNAANALAGSADGRIMSQQVAVALATDRLREAEANLAIIRSKAPGALQDYARAQEAWTVASVRAEAASQALVVSQTELAAANAAAGTRLGAFRAALSGIGGFLSGPFGMIALIAAATAGIELFNRANRSVDDVLHDLRGTFDEYRSTQARLSADTDALTKANDKLALAIASGGDAAQKAARVEVDSMNRRIAKSKEYLESQKRIAQSELDIAAAALKALENRGNQSAGLRFSPGVTIGQLDKRALEDAGKLRAANPNAVISQQALDAEKRQAEVAKARIAVDDAREAYKHLGDAVEETTKALDNDGGFSNAITVSGRAAGNATSNLRGYRTELEQLNDTFTEIGQFRRGLADVASDLDAAYSRALAAGPKNAAEINQLFALGTRAMEASAISARGAGEASRAAVQGLLDYSRAAKDALAAQLALEEAKKRGYLLDKDERDFVRPAFKAQDRAAIDQQFDRLFKPFDDTTNGGKPFEVFDESAAAMREYARSLQEAEHASLGLRLATNAIDATLNDQIRTWEDVERVALDALRQIVQEWLRTRETMKNNNIGDLFLSLFSYAAGGSAAAGGGANASSGGGTPVSARQYHDGGMIGEAGTMRVVSLSAFRNAPRHHMGLLPDERPIIAQTGERMFSRDDNKSLIRAIAQGGGAENVKIEIINQSGGQVETSERKAPDGSRLVRITVRREVKAMFGDGSLDGVMGETYGVGRKARSR